MHQQSYESSRPSFDVYDEGPGAGPGAGERLREAAAEHPGMTALVSLLSSPLAIRAAGVTLRWARRNPVLAIGLAVGAYALWNRRRANDDAEDLHASL